LIGVRCLVQYLVPTAQPPGYRTDRILTDGYLVRDVSVPGPLQVIGGGVENILPDPSLPDRFMQGIRQQHKVTGSDTVQVADVGVEVAHLGIPGEPFVALNAPI
jgi:hypothetical protein